ncbi:MAG: hypothetical protein SXG53_25735 [Pseudomonadota bacterium]|nr:hypothetical protein [Pseudomonadota bacterium]
MDVVTRPSANGARVLDSVVLASANILWIEPDAYMAPFMSQQQAGAVSYETVGLGDFEKKLSREMTIPRHLLKVTYDFDRGSVRSLMVQAGSSTRKRG